MLKAIINYLHKITFGNTGTQTHDQCPKYFKKIYATAASMLKKICLPQMFAKNYFGNTVAVQIQFKNTFFCWLIAV